MLYCSRGDTVCAQSVCVCECSKGDNKLRIILVRSKAATSLVNMLYSVQTLDLRSPSPVRVRGCRLVRCTPKAMNSSTRNVQRTSESAPGSGVAFRAATLQDFRREIIGVRARVGLPQAARCAARVVL